MECCSKCRVLKGECVSMDSMDSTFHLFFQFSNTKISSQAKPGWLVSSESQLDIETEEEVSVGPQLKTPEGTCEAVRPEKENAIEGSARGVSERRLDNDSSVRNFHGENLQQSGTENISRPPVRTTSVLDQDPSWIYNDFDADDLSQVIAVMSTMTPADMTAEEYAEAMLPLVVLRDEAR